MWKFFAGAACALVLTAPAAAAVGVLEGVGSIEVGVDQSGLFGVPGDLTGLPLLLRLRYDTALAPTGFGGIFISNDPQWLQVELSVGGVPVAFEQRPGPDYFTEVHLIEDGVRDLFNVIYQARGTVSGGEVDQTLTLSLEGDFFTSTAVVPLLQGPLDGVGMGEFFFDDRACAAACEPLRRAEGFFELTGVTAAVPEPSAWALMIAGFGATGAILRRRRKEPRSPGGGAPKAVALAAA